jgi:cyanate permease
MLAYLAGARQLALFTTDALAGKGIEITAILAPSLYQRDKEFEANLCLLLLDQVAGAFGQIATYMII